MEQAPLGVPEGSRTIREIVRSFVGTGVSSKDVREIVGQLYERRERQIEAGEDPGPEITVGARDRTGKFWTYVLAEYVTDIRARLSESLAHRPDPLPRDWPRLAELAEHGNMPEEHAEDMAAYVIRSMVVGTEDLDAATSELMGPRQIPGSQPPVYAIGVSPAVANAVFEIMDTTPSPDSQQ